MSIDASVLTATALQQQFGLPAYQRGLSYFNSGRATLGKTRLAEEGAVVLYTRNWGRRKRPYNQEIYLYSGNDGVQIRGFCDCPVGFNCKHVVAGCLAWRQSNARNGEVDSGLFEQWLTRLETVAEGMPSEEMLLYLLEPGMKVGRGRPIPGVHFAVVKRRRDGEWSKGRSLTISTLSNRYDGAPRYLQSVDREIITLLQASHPYHWGGGIPLAGAAGHTALKLMVGSGRLFLGREVRQGPLRHGPEAELPLAWEKHDGEYRLAIGREGLRVIATVPRCYVDPSRLEVGRLTLPGGISAEKLALLEQAPPVSTKEVDRISRLLALRHPELPTPTEVPLSVIREAPTPVLALHFTPASSVGTLALAFDYARVRIAPDSQTPWHTVEQGDALVRIERDPVAEAKAEERLLTEGVEPLPGGRGQFTLPLPEGGRQAELAAWFAFLEHAVQHLEAEGWRVEHAAENPLTLSNTDTIDAKVESSGNDWFELRFDLDIEGTKIPLLPLVSDLLADYRPGRLPETLYLNAGNGHFIAVPAERIEPVLQAIVDLFERDGSDGEMLRLSRLDAPRLLELGDARVQGGETLQRLARRLRDFGGIEEIRLPTTFKGLLRPYQQQGLNWLQFLRQYELAGVLADDMGLGKTVQTLAHLAVEKRAGRMKRPSLIVAPTSLMGNWRREAAQFTPRLRVLVLHGPDRGDHFEALDRYDLVLTTYPLLPRDGDVLVEQPWYYVVLDEAQQIKNPNSQAAQLVRELKVERRLCLTGTPMENHLGELWAQFDFLLPGFLGSRQAFTRNYRTPIEKQGDGDKLRRLTRRTAPFLLRRTKAMVAKELPPKTDLLRTVAVEGKQAVLYEGVRLTMEKRVREAIAQKGLARSHITVLDALLKLRQVCCDPRLLPKGTRGTRTAGSAKLAMLMEMLPEMLDEGRRILLFSQFTTMLGLIEQELNELGIGYAKLTGQTRKREEAIALFRSGAVNVFLVSLKAGGVGLNLTEADTVIHYDPWWNPAVEAQATDRAHRIGQDKPVFVYKLITEGTVEEKILALQSRKRQLADNVYGKGQRGEELPIDAETISALFAAS